MIAYLFVPQRDDDISSSVMLNAKMKKRIVFVGGIHGVGKGTICKAIAKECAIPHYSASQLLKWTEISTEQNKRVTDFDETQERLLKGIENTIQNNVLSLLDGHFILLNKEGIPEIIDEQIFIKIHPIAIGVVTKKPELIKEQLENRDNKEYDLNILMEMQRLELSHSKYISKKLKLPFFEINGGGLDVLQDYVKRNK